MEREESKRPLTTSDMSRLYLVAVLDRQGAHEDAVALTEDITSGLARDVGDALLDHEESTDPLVRRIVQHLRTAAEASPQVAVA